MLKKYLAYVGNFSTVATVILVAFLLVFVVLIWKTMRMRPDKVEALEKLPLDEG